MFGMTDRTTTNTILSTFQALGTNPPKTLDAAFAESEKLSGWATKRPETRSLEHALSAAILAGRDVYTDPDVQTAVTAQHLANNAGLSEVLTAAGTERVREACLLELDAIVRSWAKHFDKAALTLAAAFVRIGQVPLTDSDAILARGGDIAEVWAEAKMAEQTIDTILAGWTSLMQFVRVPLNAEQRALRLAEMTAEDFRSVSPKAGGWGAVRAGLTLSLPTLAEYRQRIARLEGDRAAERAAETPVDAQREDVKSWARRTAQAVS